MGSRGKMFWFLALLPIMTGFDWGTKHLAQQLPAHAEVHVIPGWVSFVHAENPYAAFSTPLPVPFLIGAGVVLLTGLLFTVWRLPQTARVQAAALALVCAGGVGNLVDRILDGTVTDFVRVYTEHPMLAPWLIERFGTATWPIFNVADASLLCGVALWVIHGLFEREEPPMHDGGVDAQAPSV
jgi:signal peptidase II